VRKKPDGDTLPPGVEVAVGDLLDVPSLVRAATGVDKLFLLNARGGAPSDPGARSVAGDAAPAPVIVETCTEAFGLAGIGRQHGHAVRVVAATWFGRWASGSVG